MNKKKIIVKESIYVVILICIIFICGGIIGWNYGYLGYDLLHMSNNLEGRAALIETMNIVSKNYDGKFDQNKESITLIQHLLNDLHDPFTYYISKEEYQKLKQQDVGQYAGLGINYSLSQKIPVILDVFPGSPAASAGLKNGDRITAINTIAVTSFKNELELINHLKGKEGESVRLEIDDHDVKKVVTIKRAKFKLPTFAYKKLDSSIGYLKVYHFNPYLQKDFLNIEKSMKHDSIKKLVIDLRNNTGGEAGTAVYLADQFLKEGIIVRERYKPDNKEVIHKASGVALFADVKLIILVNKQTASESEVFAAAIQDNKRGTVVGEQTYGKGIATSFFELKDGSAIRLTTGKWFTPSGNWIGAGKGIKPDIIFTREKISSDSILQILEKLF